MEISRRQLLGGIVGAAVAPALVPEVPAAFASIDNVAGAYDVLTMEQILAAVQKLRDAQVPAFDGMNYACFIHPSRLAAARFQSDLWRRENDSLAYRARSTTEEIFQHEMRRQNLGRRDDYPTFEECFSRARALG